MIVRATVVFPVYVEIDVQEIEDEGVIREKLLKEAAECLQKDTIKPIITECSIPTIGE